MPVGLAKALLGSRDEDPGLVGFALGLGFGFDLVAVVLLLAVATSAAADLAGAKSALHPLKTLIPEE